MVNHPDYYHWSSHRYYSGETVPDWMEIDFVLTTIKNTTSYDYQNFINKPIDREKWKPTLYISENDDLIINEDVVYNLNSAADGNDAVPTKMKFLSSTVVSDVVCQNLNIQYHRLSGLSRDRKTSQKRMLLVHFWLMYSNLTMTDIAKQLRRTHGTLLRQLNELNLENNNHFSKKLLKKIQAELDALGA